METKTSKAEKLCGEECLIDEKGQWSAGCDIDFVQTLLTTYSSTSQRFASHSRQRNGKFGGVPQPHWHVLGSLSDSTSMVPYALRVSQANPKVA